MEKIKVNNVILSEYLKSTEQLELEREMQNLHSEVNAEKQLYKKPRLRILSRKERNGMVKQLQEEINFRNRENLIGRAIEENKLTNAFLALLIGSYKEKEPWTCLSIANEFKRIVEKNKLDFGKNIFHGVKMALGYTRKSMFNEYLIYRKRFSKPSLIYLRPEGYQLDYDSALNLFKNKLANDNHKDISNELIEPTLEVTPNTLEIKAPSTEELKEKGIIINFNAEVTIKIVMP